MRSLIVILFLVLLALQYKLWLGEGNLLQWRKLEKQLSTQIKLNEELEARNQGIEATIAELKSGDQALEEEARYELGMIKEGEVYYQLVN